MICVGIDVAKDEHDCFILSSEGEVLADVFTVANNVEGFDTLLQTIRSCTRPEDKIKVGLEATGHHSYNILGFLLDCGLPKLSSNSELFNLKTLFQVFGNKLIVLEYTIGMSPSK